MKNKIFALLLVLVLVLGALAACGNKTEEPASQSGNEQPSENTEKEPEKEPEPTGNLRKTTTSQAENALRAVINSDLHTIDPHHAAVDNELRIANMIYDTLMQRDEDLNWVPMAALSIEPNEDGTEVLVTMRDDIVFASGDKLCAEDFAYSLARCENSVQMPTYLFDTTSIEPIDDTHFKWYFPAEGLDYFTLADYANSMFLFNKSYCEQIISSPGEDMLFNVDGSGPYKLESPLSAGIHDVTMIRNEYAWDKVSLDKIYFKYLSGDYEMAFESGDIDYSGYSPDTFDTAKAFDNVYTTTNFSGYTYMLILNCSENSPFHDPIVREALQYGFDREVAGLVACNNNGQVAWTLATPACKNWSDCVPHRDIDQDKCRAMMQQAGYSEANPCKVVLFSMSTPNWISTLEILKEELDTCYFECTIEEAADTTRYFSGDFDVSIIGLNMDNNLNSYGALFDANTGFNLAMYTEADALDIYDEFLHIDSPESGAKAIQHFDAANAYIPLSYVSSNFACDANLDPGPYINGYNIRFMKWKN